MYVGFDWGKIIGYHHSESWMITLPDGQKNWYHKSNNSYSKGVPLKKGTRFFIIFQTKCLGFSVKSRRCTLWLFCVAIENGPFIV